MNSAMTVQGETSRKECNGPERSDGVREGQTNKRREIKRGFAVDRTTTRMKIK